MRHRVPPERLAFLTSGRAGLDSEIAAEARRRFGDNDIVGAPTSGWRAIAVDTIRDPMLWFLLATAGLFQWLGDHTEAVVLAAALLPILGMDAWLHWRTQASTASLASRLDPRARVLRDRRWIEVAATDVVPGDLLDVRPGEHAAADGVVIEAEKVQLDESALTGESMPVRKHALPGAPLGDEVDHEHWIAAGTRMLVGTARVRVLLTGKDTLYGEIARLSKAGNAERTPLQRSLDRLVGRLLIGAGALCLLLAGVRLAQGHGAIDALVSGATLAVAALPEEFPVAFAFFLGVGVYRLAQRQALVRRAAVVENIGRVTCLCTDKTGTLTVGELRLVALLAGDDSDEATLVTAAAAASRQDSGDPVDQAIFAYQRAAESAGRSPAPPAVVVTNFPFTEQRRREVTVVRDPAGHHLAFAKGAPEAIFELCNLSVVARARWREVLVEQAKDARKLIACAARDVTGWDGGEPACGFALVGMLAFEDPLRPEARETVASVAAAGLRLIMLTGDHPATASAIAVRAGLGAASPRLIEGEALEAALRKDPRLTSVDVVARCLPTQKLALVQALRGAGEIVAVTGDGVNDAPALSAADVGIAMGQRGTRSAREAASIVLLDDDLRSLVRAIAEGRQLFRNLQTAFAYLLLVHIPLVLTAALVPLLGFPLVLLPIHIVWLELVIHPTLLLVFQELPRHSSKPLQATQKARFFSVSQIITIGIGGLLLTIIVAGAYLASLHATQDAAQARTFSLSALLAVSAGVTAGLTGLRTRASRVAVATTLLTTAVAVSTPAIASTLSLSVAGVGVLATSMAAAITSALIASMLREVPSALLIRWHDTNDQPSPPVKS
ncbi:cation-translocating P-type ATPase [Lysobacter soli]|uniref:cation-translocating P-type ATPase n=1 Tax=Lysobacter soli TaxID=453783 RepID=UPI00240F9134|nr:cation-transporting P-type ATPase [Lysobacter soli]MDG2518372.1 cation-transporting P-type ATPase [Lysobacter soli]